MTHPRRALVALVVIAAFATGCTPAATPLSTPTPVPSSATPTPTPTPSPTPSSTYGPNQTAALAVAKAYLDWINTASKKPAKPDLEKLSKLASGDAYTAAFTTTVFLDQDKQYRVGDLIIAEMIPGPEHPSQIGVTVCKDSSQSARVDSSGQTFPPIDGLYRRQYSLTVSLIDGHWMVNDDKGGMTSC